MTTQMSVSGLSRPHIKVALEINVCTLVPPIEMFITRQEIMDIVPTEVGDALCNHSQGDYTFTTVCVT